MTHCRRLTGWRKRRRSYWVSFHILHNVYLHMTVCYALFSFSLKFLILSFFLFSSFLNNPRHEFSCIPLVNRSSAILKNTCVGCIGIFLSLSTIYRPSTWIKYEFYWLYKGRKKNKVEIKNICHTQKYLLVICFFFFFLY